MPKKTVAGFGVARVFDEQLVVEIKPTSPRALKAECVDATRLGGEVPRVARPEMTPIHPGRELARPECSAAPDDAGFHWGSVAHIAIPVFES